MPRKITVSLLLVILMSLAVSVAYAQDVPRPTPTDMGPTVPPETTPEPSNNSHGTVRGFVYIDVNGDGNCVNTGVAGEEAIAGVPVEFVSSDKKHVITNTSGANGAYELAGAGQSYWQVTAKPDTTWVVTSVNPQSALVAADSLVAAGVNFCVAKAGTAVYPIVAPISATLAEETYFLPASGAPATAPSPTLWLVLIGLSFIAIGLGWRWHEVSRR
jgi:hypothetical protein